jgi:DNA modification methylase
MAKPTTPKPQAEEAAPSRPNRGDLNDLTGKEWIKATKSWFVCDSRRYRRNKATEFHPARYPEEMVSRFLEFFTQQDGWVLDPFCGSGATLVSCLETGRRGVGVELSPRYARITAARLEALSPDHRVRVIEGDSRQIATPAFWQQGPGPEHYAERLPQFDFIITSPPYWNMLHTSRGGVLSAQKRRARRGLDTHYSSAEEDLGNVESYEDFIESLGTVFDACARLLKPRKYLVCVVQNCRTPEGEVKPLAWDLARRISRTLSFQGERIWCQDSKPLGIWGFPKVFVPNYHHHYCLIFQNTRP